MLLHLPLSDIINRATKIIGDIEFASTHGFSGLPGILRVHELLEQKDR